MYLSQVNSLECFHNQKFFLLLCKYVVDYQLHCYYVLLLGTDVVSVGLIDFWLHLAVRASLHNRCIFEPSILKLHFVSFLINAFVVMVIWGTRVAVL
jgi:hypothetical protein